MENGVKKGDTNFLKQYISFSFLSFLALSFVNLTNDLIHVFLGLSKEYTACMLSSLSNQSSLYTIITLRLATSSGTCPALTSCISSAAADCLTSSRSSSITSVSSSQPSSILSVKTIQHCQ